MTTSAIFHAFLRPAILQILRATGFHSTKPAVLDSLTDLAARYLLALCESTAKHATDNEGDAADFTAVDVRLAMQDVGALLPSSGKLDDDGEWRGDDDTRGVDEFIAWFSSQRMKELLEFGNSEGDTEATDYLNGLKTKHNKTGDEVKYQGTILGRSAEGSEVQVEGGDVTSIEEWMLLHAKTAIPREPGSSPQGAEAEDADVDADGELEAPTQDDTEMAMT